MQFCNFVFRKSIVVYSAQRRHPSGDNDAASWPAKPDVSCTRKVMVKPNLRSRQAQIRANDPMGTSIRAFLSTFAESEREESVLTGGNLDL